MGQKHACKSDCCLLQQISARLCLLVSMKFESGFCLILFFRSLKTRIQKQYPDAFKDAVADNRPDLEVPKWELTDDFFCTWSFLLSVIFWENSSVGPLFILFVYENQLYQEVLAVSFAILVFALCTVQSDEEFLWLIISAGYDCFPSFNHSFLHKAMPVCSMSLSFVVEYAYISILVE
jgi:hypothetical protein